MKACLVSTLTNSYVPGAFVFLRSLLLHNTIRLPYIIFEVEPLTQDNKIKLLRVYPNITFRPINSNDYQYNTLSSQWRAWQYNVFNRFEIFSLEEYDRVYFFDVDIVVLKSIQQYLDLEADFIVVPTLDSEGIDHAVARPFDAGVMSISKRFLRSDVRVSLIDLSQSKQWSSDEPVLNQYFAPYVTWADYQYNTLTSNLSIPLFRNASLLQFVGEKKPWHGRNTADIYDKHILTTSDRASLSLARTAFNNFHDHS